MNKENATTCDNIIVISGDDIIIALVKKIITQNLKGYSINVYKDYSVLMQDKMFESAIIITDEQIVGSSGLELINIIRYIKKELNPIIFLCNTEIVGNKALQLGANHIIMKPIFIDNLLAAITNHNKPN